VRQRVLHFAPEVVLRNVLVKLPNVEYRTTDLLMKGVDYPGENIERLSFPNRSFDVVLCNHVLEHVANDEAAMRELARILAPTGVAVITIPGEWSRPETITFPNTDLNGHYRDYGMDAKERFQQCFETVELFDQYALNHASNGLSYGIRPGDVAFICRRPRACPV
jgi:ubiquinone/menaquinone biosynthesis C-methylase UbiE